MRIFGTILAGGEGRRMGADKALMLLAGRPLVAWVAERFAPQVEELSLSANGDPARFAGLGLRKGLIILPDATSDDPHSGNLSPNAHPNGPNSSIGSLNAASQASPLGMRSHHSSPDGLSSGMRSNAVSNCASFGVQSPNAPSEHSLAGIGSPNSGIPSSNALSKGPLSGILSGLIWAAPLGATALVVVPCDGPFLPPDLVPRLCLAGENGTPVLATSGTDIHPTYSLWPITLLPVLQAFLASDAIPRVRDFAVAHGAALAAFPPGSFANANTRQDLARLETHLTAQRGGLA